jgi:FtsP/CotA-like multicopper oxidase with cupredoxin domain
MRAVSRFSSVVLFVCGFALSAVAQLPQCPLRPKTGVEIKNPLDLVSKNGELKVDLTLRNAQDAQGFMHVCYDYQDGDDRVESPTLRLNPGDILQLDLTNRLVAKSVNGLILNGKDEMEMSDMSDSADDDPCHGTHMTAASTNIHFHGMNIPPICHQDEVIFTLIRPDTPTFEYRFQVPPNDAPGMYWYHPHPHGFASTQVNGGATGALIINGIENIKPEVSGLPERILLVRQQFLNGNAWVPGPNQLTINYQQAPSHPPYGVIKVKPGQKEFWRVANTTIQAFVTLQVRIGKTPQKLELIALDGIPVKYRQELTTILIPPAGRAEFIVPGLPKDADASFVTAGYNTGIAGNPNPETEFAQISVTDDAIEPPPIVPAIIPPVAPRFAGLENATPTKQRKLYFSERFGGVNSPIQFYITVDGQKPKVFTQDQPPSIVTHVGAVEDWTIENRAFETHDFHIHQIHFLVLEQNGKKVKYPELRDSIQVPFWSGKGPYPSVKLRMDFRQPSIAGTFVYHCHILDHEDAGMMAKIRVDPK